MFRKAREIADGGSELNFDIYFYSVSRLIKSTRKQKRKLGGLMILIFLFLKTVRTTVID